MVVTDLTGFLANNGDIMLGMLFVGIVIAVTLVMTAQSDRPDAPQRRTER
jgi:hypothetical protein